MTASLPRRPLVVAHRALSPGMPENSLAAIRRAAALGADLVELDVRRSLEGVPFVVHDPWLGRTTAGTGPVRLWPAACLSRLRLRGGAGERLPTLAAALALLAESPDGPGPALHVKDRGALLAALRAVRMAGIEGRTWLWLHGLEAARLAAREAPAARVTLLEPRRWDRADWPAHLSAARAVGAAALSVPHPVLIPPTLEVAHAYDLAVFSVVQEPAAVVRAVTAGLDGVITDDPAAARAAVEAVAAVRAALSAR